MKRCPSCNRNYTDEALNFCLEDGTPLVADSPAESNATTPYSPPRDTNSPPTAIYHPQPGAGQPPRGNQAVPFQPQWAPVPMAQPRRSNAIWWILGSLAVLSVLGIGLAIVIIAVASMSSSPNNNNANLSNRNANYRANANTANANSTSGLPTSFNDDFSTQSWGTGSSQYGDRWYANDEYHMRSKADTYIVMYGPTADYNTENATVRVTARNVDGTTPAFGYGLCVHGEQGKLEDYAFLIKSGDDPQFRIVLHRDSKETEMVPWTKSTAIRSGTVPNQLEVRIKGSLLSFYINGQFAKSIMDTANYKRGRVGFYASDVHEVAFDDLQIRR